MPTYNIAIDGPAGAGKSTIARMLAGRLGYIYVDTGAMYRAMALHFLRQGADLSDEPAIADGCRDIRIQIEHRDGVQRVLLDGEDVTGLIREEEVGNAASAISAYLPVRERLLELQRSLARESDVVMDGRDIGTCVLPGAQTKVYLTASSRVRAMRRFEELQGKGQDCDLDEIQRDIEDRDRRDREREHAPLRQAEDAVLLDSSDMTPSQVEEAILDIVGRGQEGRWK